MPDPQQEAERIVQTWTDKMQVDSVTGYMGKQTATQLLIPLITTALTQRDRETAAKCAGIAEQHLCDAQRECPKHIKEAWRRDEYAVCECDKKTSCNHQEAITTAIRQAFGVGDG